MGEERTMRSTPVMMSVAPNHHFPGRGSEKSNQPKKAWFERKQTQPRSESSKVNENEKFDYQASDAQ